MTEHENQNAWKNANKLAPLYRPAMASAVIAAVVGLVALGVMLVDRAVLKAVDPFNAPALESMKQTLADHGEDENLRARIRELDFQIRQEYFSRHDRMVNGKSVLLGAAVAILASLAVAGGAKPSRWLPPKAGNEPPAKPMRDARLAKAGVLVAAFVFVMAGFAAWPWGPSPPPGLPFGDDIADATPGDTGTHADPTNDDAGLAVANAASHTTSPAAPRPVLTGRWPMFRGPNAQGISPAKNVPLAWDAPANKNIAWKTKLPLPSPSSPIAWDDKVFVSGASDDGKKLGLTCLDAVDGRVLWHKEISPTHPKPADVSINREAGFAAPTPATDGQLVFTLYASGDLVAYDFEGNRKWLKTFPWPHNRYAHATSLVVVDGLVIVLIDQEPPYPGALYALDGATGEERWRADRTTIDSWTVPLLAQVNGQDLIVTVAKPDIIVYDTRGGVVWRTPWVDRDMDAVEPAASPALADGMLVAATAFARCIAIPIDVTGDASRKIEWEISRDLPDICSLLAVGENVLMISDQATLSCFSAKECDEFYTHTYSRSFYASPIFADDKVYLIDEDGLCFVIAPGTEYNVLATNPLGEDVSATPAVIDGRLFIRGQTHLFCIAEVGGE
ncbi:MAG: PQQ-like beta-propeller repeat protein [Phycisphaerae bacterium]|nr:PQQ-like beta-propeller repeat protein [Phycisphaerae bacterium]